MWGSLQSLDNEGVQVVKTPVWSEAGATSVDKTLTDFLQTLGFEPLAADSGIYAKDGLFIAIYVDDLLIIGRNKGEIKKVKEALSQRFKMTDLGACGFYLGIRITRDRASRPIQLDQQGYVEQLLQAFGMAECAAADTPMAESAEPEKPVEGWVAVFSEMKSYQSAVGSLMYLIRIH